MLSASSFSYEAIDRMAGETYSAGVELIGDYFDLNVHGQVPFPLEPRLCKAYDVPDLPFCSRIGSIEISEAGVIPDMDLGFDACWKLSIHGSYLTASSFGNDCVRLIWELESFRGVDLVCLAVLEEQEDEATRDEPA